MNTENWGHTGGYTIRTESANNEANFDYRKITPSSSICLLIFPLTNSDHNEVTQTARPANLSSSETDLNNNKETGL